MGWFVCFGFVFGWLGLGFFLVHPNQMSNLSLFGSFWTLTAGRRHLSCNYSSLTSKLHSCRHVHGHPRAEPVIHRQEYEPEMALPVCLPCGCGILGGLDLAHTHLIPGELPAVIRSSPAWLPVLWSALQWPAAPELSVRPAWKQFQLFPSSGLSGKLEEKFFKLFPEFQAAVAVCVEVSCFRAERDQ